MPAVQPKSIISFSSEDPAHPAANLLQADTYRKWKCKESGSKSEFVIMQLEKAVSFMQIDIGNESSAFVEILVGRSGQNPQEFEVLLSNVAIMSPTESRNNTSANRVRMFGLDKLNKMVAAEKWDLVKVVCSQEFNTHIQYGLAFINLRAVADPNEKSKIGGFAIRSTGEDDESPNLSLSSGSLFAKHKKTKDDSPSNRGSSSAAAIRASSSLTLASTAITSNEERVKDLKKRKLDMKAADAEEVGSSGGSGSNSRSHSPLLSRKKPEDSRKNSQSASPNTSSSSKSKRKDDQVSTKATSKLKLSKPQNKSRMDENSDEEEEEEEEEVASSSGKKSKPSSQQKPRKTKPFHQLFEGVVFVLSGFQNPERSNIRRKAVEMGARCKPDWDASCTHLICAFVNTPKFRDVRRSGHGEIVKKDWIEASYRAKCRFPWRRYCLVRDDVASDSEEEIYALDDEDDEEYEEALKSRSRGDKTAAKEEGESSSTNGKRKTTRDDDDDDADGGSPVRKTTRTDDGSSKRENSPSSSETTALINSPKKKSGAVLDLGNEGKGSSEKPTPEEGVTAPTSTDKGERGRKKKRGSKGNDSKDDEDSETCSEDDLRYSADTDVDEENSGKCSDGSNNFWDGVCFYLFHDPKRSPSLVNENRDQRDNIEQIIRLHKGRIETDRTDKVEYILTDGNCWEEEFTEAMDENPNAKVVRTEWIIECHKKNERIPVENFRVMPN